MVKLADTQDLGSCAEKRAGSSPVIRTIAFYPSKYDVYWGFTIFKSL